MTRSQTSALALLAVVAACAAPLRAEARTPLIRALKKTPFKIAWECYVNHNWEIFTMNSDGSHKVDITNTPRIHED